MLYFLYAFPIMLCILLVLYVVNKKEALWGAVADYPGLSVVIALPVCIIGGVLLGTVWFVLLIVTAIVGVITIVVRSIRRMLTLERPKAIRPL